MKRSNLIITVGTIVLAVATVLLSGALKHASPTPGLAQQAAFSGCPPADGWATAVWLGASNTPVGQAIATCAAVSIDAVFWFNAQEQSWRFYFAAAPPGVNTLATLDSGQVVFLHGLAGTSPSPTASPTPRLSPTPTATPTPVPTPLPFIDAHNHMMPGLTAEAMIAVMDRVGASRIIVMAKGEPLSASTQRTLDAQGKFPDRVIPYLGLNSVQTVTRQVLDFLDSQLATGKFNGIGELLALHYESRPGSPNQFPRVEIPMDSPGALDLLCLAAKYNVVLVIHMETTSETVAKLELALQQYPNAKVVWAHQTHVKTLDGDGPENARKADPQQIASLMDRHPNLHADIAPGHESFFLTSNDRQLPENWKALYERYSDRFVVGLDMPFLDTWQDAEAPLNRVGWIRVWLSQLSPETQRKFASENIERILRDRPAAGQACQFRTQ